MVVKSLIYVSLPNMLHNCDINGCSLLINNTISAFIVYKFNVSNALTSSSSNDMTIFSDASLYSCRSSSHSMLLLTSLMIDDSKTHCFAVKPFILNVLFFIISKP